MFGASRDAVHSLRNGLESMRADAGFAELVGDLRAVSDLLEREKSLRLALSDSGRSVQTRRDIATAVLAERVGPLALDVVQDAVSQRWSDPSDLVEALHTSADTAALMLAQDAGDLDRVEDELFGIQQLLGQSAQLQAVLTNPAIPAGTKGAVIADLLGDRVAPRTAEMVEFALSHLRGRRSDDVMQALMTLAAEERNRLVAEVMVARPLQAEQVMRLTERLSASKGKDVRVNVIVDPKVLGGVHVTLAGEVIDGTIASRLDQARRVVAG